MKNIPIAKPYLSLEEKKYINDAVNSNWISSQGKFIKKFEKKFCQFNKTKFSVAVPNGSLALLLALKAIDIKAGDEVIVPNLTFSATINAIIFAGAIPVIVDVKKDSWTIDPIEIKNKISKKTKAIIIVHLYGNVADIKSLKKIKKDKDIKIIEDCAEAHGAEYNGRKVGSFFDVGTFSFYANKIFTTGEGGICCTNNKKIFQKLILLKNQGLRNKSSIPNYKKYYCYDYGLNFRMTNLQAAIGYGQLKNAKKILKDRERITQIYNKKLYKNKFISLRKIDKKTKPVNWIYTVMVKKKLNGLMSYLNKKGIETRPVFYPFNKTNIYKKYIKRGNKDFHNSLIFFKKGLSLPTYYGIKLSEIDYICKSINKFFYEKK